MMIGDLGVRVTVMNEIPPRANRGVKKVTKTTFCSLARASHGALNWARQDECLPLRTVSSRSMLRSHRDQLHCCRRT